VRKGGREGGKEEEEEEYVRGGGTRKSFLTPINAHLTLFPNLWARPPCPSWCSSRAFDYHIALCFADFRIQRILTHQPNNTEFVFTGTKGNHLKIPSRSLSNGWYRTLKIFHS